MLSKNFIILNSFCLGIGYAGTLWIKVTARLGLETSVDAPKTLHYPLFLR